MEAESRGYKLLGKIAEGASGQVVRAQCLKTMTDVAIKLITDFSDHNYQIVKVYREMLIIKHLQKQQAAG